MPRQFFILRSIFRPSRLLPAHNDHPWPQRSLARSFTHSAATNLKQMPPRPKPPPESEIEEFFLKGSGPGGQKINKTNSAVQLRHIPTGIVVKSQATRSRSQNRNIARELLAARLDELRNGGASRTAVVGDVKRKRAASKAKKSRRKYRKLAGAQEQEGQEEEGEEGGEEEYPEQWEALEGKTNGKSTGEANTASQSDTAGEGRKATDKNSRDDTNRALGA